MLSRDRVVNDALLRIYGVKHSSEVGKKCEVEVGSASVCGRILRSPALLKCVLRGELYCVGTKRSTATFRTLLNLQFQLTAN